MNQHIKDYEITNEENIELIKKFIVTKKENKGSLSPMTLKNSKQTIIKLAKHINPKNLKEVTEQDLRNFFNTINENNYRSRDTYATNIIQFYRWLFNSPKTTPPNMAWFQYTSNRTKRKLQDIHAIEKYLITPDEYKKMLTWGNDQYGQSKAIWETLYLSGVRPSELLSMRIEDVTTENGKTTIAVPESKTFPRTIPIEIPPLNLLQYKENHPRKDNKRAWLWFPFKNTATDKPLQYDNLKNERFNKMIKDLNLKPTLNLKSFRKTRATLIFNGKKLQLIEIAKIMGWTTKTVVDRQEEYLLTNNEEIFKKYCTESYTEPTQQQLKTIQIETIDKLKKDNEELNQKIKHLSNIVGNTLTTKTEEAVESILTTICKDAKTEQEAIDKLGLWIGVFLNKKQKLKSNNTTTQN